jgi:hypothetical protein
MAFARFRSGLERDLLSKSHCAGQQIAIDELIDNA